MARKKKIVLVISDLHLGAGVYLPGGSINFREDFLFDRYLVEFIQFYRSGQYRNQEVELIVNGDCFEMLETSDYEEDPLRMTETLAVRRIEQIMKGHASVFAELKTFASTPGKSLRFLCGNHDMVLIFPAVRQLIKDRVHSRTLFNDWNHTFADVYVEHGNRFFHCSRYDPDRLTVETQPGVRILNHDWLSIFCVENIYKKKTNKYNFALYRVFPYFKVVSKIIRESPLVAMRYLLSYLLYILASLLKKPKYGLTNGRINRNIFKSLSEDLTLSLDRAGEKILRESSCRLVIFGHAHNYRYREIEKGKIYINTGSWNTQVNLNVQSIGTWTKFCYALVEHDGKKSRAELKEWKGFQVPDRTLFP